MGHLTQRLDYDRIAHLFDEPLRDHEVDPHLVRFIEEDARRRAQDVSILDVGCGTGKQLASNRAAFPHLRMTGLDRFAGMLQIARARCPTVTWVHGDGARLPFRSTSFDYVSNQFSYPHVRDKRSLIAEIFRVLTPRGRFVMTNIDPWSMPDWAIYRFFPEARRLDEQDFLPVHEFAGLMTSAGFDGVTTERTRSGVRESLRGFLDYVSGRHRSSHFMAMSDAAYGAGIRRIQEALDNTDDPDETFDNDVVMVTITGQKSYSSR